MRAATVVQVLQDLFQVLLHALFYSWSLLKTSVVELPTGGEMEKSAKAQPGRGNAEK